MKLIRHLLFPIYLLQLENYNLERFFRESVAHIINRPTLWRKKIVWTNKLIVVTAIALVLIAIPGWAIAQFSIMLGLLATLVALYKLFVFLLLATVVIRPLEAAVTYWIIQKARQTLKKHPNLIVIGIAGSYGKTTMKEMVTSVLKQKYQVLSSPETTNTPIGISRLITNHLSLTTEVFIVEMGEHWQGDVKELCELVHPSMAIITGINEAHLERLGNLGTTISTIFELARHSKPNGLLIMNADDANIVGHYIKHIGNHKVEFYSSGSFELSKYKVNDVRFDENGGGQTFNISNPSSVMPSLESASSPRDLDSGSERKINLRSSWAGMTLSTKLLGHYAIGTSIAATILGKELGLSHTQIQKGINDLEPVPHRLQPMWNKENNVLIIDDSFNGNPAGVREAIETLAKFKNRRKIVLTPGLVEIGSETREVHENIGKQLAKVADKVLLIQNSVTDYILKGLQTAKFNHANIIVFPTTQEAHASLGQILQPNDVILFQNDWPDNYR